VQRGECDVESENSGDDLRTRPTKVTSGERVILRRFVVICFLQEDEGLAVEARACLLLLSLSLRILESSSVALRFICCLLIALFLFIPLFFVLRLFSLYEHKIISHDTRVIFDTTYSLITISFRLSDFFTLFDDLRRVCIVR